MTTLDLQAKQDFLERDTATRDPFRAIAELVDTDVISIQVTLKRNYLGAFRVVDNGSGLSAKSAEHDFGMCAEATGRWSGRLSDDRQFQFAA